MTTSNKYFSFHCLNNVELTESQGYHPLIHEVLQIIDIKLPVSIYTINEFNNQLIITNENTLNGETITLTNGYYPSTTSLASAIQTDLNTNSIGLTFTVTADSLTNKLTITSGAINHTLEFDADLKDYTKELLGFTEDSYSGAATYTAESLINLNPVDYYGLLVSINSINQYGFIDIYNSLTKQYTLSIDCSQRSFGEFVYVDFRGDNFNLMEVSYPTTLSNIKITVYDKYGNIANLNGMPLMITFRAI